LIKLQEEIKKLQEELKHEKQYSQSLLETMKCIFNIYNYLSAQMSMFTETEVQTNLKSKADPIYKAMTLGFEVPRQISYVGIPGIL
jgi:hypothetical protein